jgi:uncharacterized protein YabE (DUF348 family)
MLEDAGVGWGEWDRVSPPLDTPLQPGLKISVRHARPVIVSADGRRTTVYTHSQAPDVILSEADIDLNPGDKLRIDGSWLADAPQLQLGERGESGGGVLGKRGAVQALSFRGQELGGRDPQPISEIEIERAVTVYLSDGGVEHAIRTTARTVGQALTEAGVLLHLGDRVYPALSTPVSTGLRVQVRRGTLVSVLVDGRVLRTRTHAHTVGDVLAELGVSLVGNDLVEPPLEASVSEGRRIQVVRISERTTVEQEEIPFETIWVGDGEMELDQRRVSDEGAMGLTRRRYKLVYHDGQEVERTLQEEWVAREPRPRQIAYGTKIVIRTLETPEGPIQYWRRIRVFLSSYTAATSGKEPGHPTYGITRLGWKMRHGIIAVDPTVIRLRSQLYVPGYGRGIAGDTGGLIKGRIIDLGHEEDDFRMYWWWGYVYVMPPVPPPSQIRWTLPDYPRE